MRGLSWRNFDFLLLGAVVLAAAFGVMMIRSAIAGNTDLAGYDVRQAYFAIAGTVVIVLLASIDPPGACWKCPVTQDDTRKRDQPIW